MAESLTHPPRKLPAFASEAEEANWWHENREQHADEFVQADREGRVGMNVAAERLARARGLITLRLAAAEKQQIDEFARRRGVTVDDYIHQLLHEGLEREANAA